MGSSHSLQGHSLATDISGVLLLQASSTSANTSLLSQGFSIPFSWHHVAGGDSDFTLLKGKC